MRFAENGDDKMEQEDGKNILLMVVSGLKEVGREDLADIDYYRDLYDQKSGKKRNKVEPFERYCALEMLRALHRELYARSPKMLDLSIKGIRELIKDGDRPRRVVLVQNKDSTAGENYSYIKGDEDVNYALKELNRLILMIEDKKMRW